MASVQKAREHGGNAVIFVSSGSQAGYYAASSTSAYGYGTQVTVKAAEEAAAQAPLQVQNVSQLRDLAASAARIFGWDKKDNPQTQINQLVISQEMIEKIREAAATED